MDELKKLQVALHEAQDWCDHNGDHNTGMVSMSVETLSIWESIVNNAILELEANGNA